LDGCYPIAAVSYYFTNVVFSLDYDIRAAVFSVEACNSACW